MLHVTQPTTDGTAVVVRQLAHAARHDGATVAVASPLEGDLPVWLAEDGVGHRPLALRRSPGPLDILAVLRLRKLFRGYDIVHLHSSKAGAVGRLAAALMRNPPSIVFTPHGWSWYVGGRLAMAYRIFERWAAGRTDAIVVVSRDELEKGELTLGAGRSMHLIENGVDAESFVPSVGGRDPALVVCVGRLSTQKGQDRLIRAAVLTNDSLRIALVGEGPQRGDWEQLARELGVSHRIDFVGATDPRPYYARATVVAMPSRWEGLSIAMLEAMATGNAIVYTAVGGTDVLDGIGLVADGETEEAIACSLAAAIEALVADPAEVKKRGDSARRRVESGLTASYVERRYVTLWRGLVAGSDLARA